MHLRFIPSLAFVILAACGPEKGTGESDTGSGAATSGTTGATSDTPTTSTTGATDATTGTGTTGDAGQPLFCGDKPTNEPECVDICVRDLDPETPVVDANCRVVETRADMSSVELPVCVMVQDSWQPPAGEVACFVVLIGRDGQQTPSPLDDMSPECIDGGHNAEIQVIRSVPMMPGACAALTCEPSDNVMRDCPNL